MSESGDGKVRTAKDSKSEKQSAGGAPPGPKATCLVRGKACLGHKADRTIAECPDRVVAIQKKLETSGYLSRCVLVEAQPAEVSVLGAPHTPEHMRAVWGMCDDAEKGSIVKWLGRDLYVSPGSRAAARTAAGGVCAAAAAVLDGRARNAFALVRPPGHHAEPNKCMGYCLINNVAVAALDALRTRKDVNRVLIVDWDVHHGNGTQAIFESDPRVVYTSIHRYQDGKFFPHTGGAAEVGSGDGKGFTVNMPLPCVKLGAEDYMRYFEYIVRPIIGEFKPDLVFVSAGFDCAQGDSVGGMEVPPEAFAHFTRALMDASGGRLVMALEGGYNLRALSESVTYCVGALLGEPLPALADPSAAGGDGFLVVSKNAAKEAEERTRAFEANLSKVIQVQSEFWKSLKQPPKRAAKKADAAPAGQEKKKKTKKKSKIPERLRARLMRGKK